MDGHPSRTAVLAIDLAYQRLDPELELRVLRNILAARHYDLSHGHSAQQVWIILQEPLKGSQAFGNSFGVIQPIDTQDDLPCPEVPLNQPRRGNNAGLRCSLCELFIIDTDGVSSNAGALAVSPDQNRFANAH